MDIRGTTDRRYINPNDSTSPKDRNFSIPTFGSFLYLIKTIKT